MNRPYGGVSDQDGLYSYTYNISILNVRMKVKFQCKMRIQIDGEAITKEAALSEGSCFIFNQQCTITQKQKPQQFITLSINIITNKGAKYIAAIAHLQHRELSRIASTGPSSKLVLSLSKCLDPDATIQLLVKDIFRNDKRLRGSSPRQNSKFKKNIIPLTANKQYSQAQSRKMQNSPPLSPRNNIHKNFNSVSRSQINAPRGIVRPYNKLITNNSKSKSKNKSIHSRTRSNHLFEARQPQRNFQLEYQKFQRLREYRQETIDIPLTTKQSFSRLKQRLKRQQLQTRKQHQKRISIQQSQATVKLEALKYRLKCEQLQKNMDDKNGSIKKLQSRIEQLQRLLSMPGYDINLISSRNMHTITSAKTLFNPTTPQASLNHNIIVQPRVATVAQKDEAVLNLQHKILMANKQLQQLKSKVIKGSKSYMEKQTQYLKQLEVKNSRISKLEQQIQNIKKSSIMNNKSEQSYKQTIQQKIKTINQFQKQHQQLYRKLAQSQKTVKILQKNIEEHRSRIEQLNRNIQGLSNEKQKLGQSLQNQLSKNTAAQLALINDKKIIQKLQSQISSLLKIKQKYHENILQSKRVQGEHKLQKKQLQATVKQLQKSIQSIQHKYKQDLESINRKCGEYESKSMQQMLRIKDLQNQINISLKNQIQNYKRTIQKLHKQCQQYKNNEKMSKKQHYNYENKIGQNQSEIELWKNKFKSLQTLHTLQMQKYQSQLGHVKQNRQKQLMSQLSLKQKNQTVASELATLNNKYLLLQQKYSKDNKQLSYKIQLQVSRNSRLQETNKKLELAIDEYRGRQRDFCTKINDLQARNKEYQQHIVNYEAQLERYKAALANSQDKLKRTTQQNEQLNKNLKQLSQKQTAIMNENHQQQYKIKSLQSELQSQTLSAQSLSLQLASCKKLMQAKQQQYQKLKSNFQQQMKIKSELKEQIMKLRLNSENTILEYERFKEQIWEIVIREFAGDQSILEDALEVVVKNKNQGVTRNATQIIGKVDQHGTPKAPKFYTLNHQQMKMVSSRKTLNNYSNQPSPRQYNSTTPQAVAMPLSLSMQSSQMLNNSEILSQIGKYSNQIKRAQNKLIEQYHILQKQLQMTKQSSFQKQENLHQQLDKTYFNLQKLEQQLTRVCSEKDLLQSRFKEYKQQIEEQVDKLNTQLQKKRQEVDQFRFTCNAIQIQKQNEKQYYQQKLTHTQNQIKKYQHNFQSLVTKSIKAQQSINKLKTELQGYQKQNKKNRQQIQIRQKKLKQMQNDKNTINKLYEDSNSKNKRLLTQLSQIQLMLANQRQNNGRNKQIIEQEEKKLLENKDFINNLIKQKEALVKQQIANSQKIIELQSIKLSLQSEVSSLKTAVQVKKQQLMLQKQELKRLSVMYKQMQLQVQTQRQTNNKISQQLKYKQKQLNMHLDNIKSKQNQFTRQIVSKNKEIQEAISKKDYSQKLLEQEKRSFRKQVNKLQHEVISKLEQQIKLLTNNLNSYKKQCQNTSKKIDENTYQINSYKQVNEKQIKIMQSQQKQINQLNEQLKQKQQQLYNLSGQLYALQQKFSQNNTLYKLQKQKIQEQFQYKYENMCEDYETRIDEMERERQYLKQKITISQEQINKLKNKIKASEEEDSKQRATQKQRYIKSEQQKKILANNMKSELKKLMDSKQILQSEIKKKEIQIQKLRGSEIIDKNLIQKLEFKIKQCESKLEQMQHLQYIQVQNQKRKQTYIKQYEQGVVNYQWALQRQIKKQLQNITKYVININIDFNTPANGNIPNLNQLLTQSKKKVTDAIKDVENKISRLTSEKIIVKNKPDN